MAQKWPKVMYSSYFDFVRYFFNYNYFRSEIRTITYSKIFKEVKQSLPIINRQPKQYGTAIALPCLGM